ncbi:MAG: amidophosphoribosyltransferase [Bacillota bacterium]
MIFDDDKLHDECGVIGIYDPDSIDTALMCYYGLIALQHRGQESAGISANNDGVITTYKAMGLVTEVFAKPVLDLLKGNMAIGHVRYSTTGDSAVCNAQPITVRGQSGDIVIAHNGNIINAASLRNELEKKGVTFESTNDSEVIAKLIAGYCEDDLSVAIKKTMNRIKGAYSLVVMSSDKIFGVRDPNGFRPLIIGEKDNSYMLASESCALDALGYSVFRDVEPGEIVLIDKNQLKIISNRKRNPKTLCMFEYIYFARPDSVIDGRSVYAARIEAGIQLAKEHPAQADIVIGVPDSGLQAGYGYASQIGIPYSVGFVKNRYIARTFIKPDQQSREISVSLKLNPIAEVVRGKRVVMVDDSIVRGTTSKRTIKALLDAGASEIHVRVASPLVVCPCYFGIDTPRKNELIAANEVLKRIKEQLGADSLGYISVAGIEKAVGGSGHCLACFNGEYPMKIPKNLDKEVLQ